jgi:hypothetical protein
MAPAPSDADPVAPPDFEGATDAVPALGTSQQPTGSLDPRPGAAAASTRNLDLTSPPSEDAPSAESASSEALDSAMVIRPAAKAASLVAAAQQARALAGAFPPPPTGGVADVDAAPPGGDDDDGDFMVDPDATLNLPARPKSMEGGLRAPAPDPSYRLWPRTPAAVRAALPPRTCAGRPAGCSSRR